MHSGAVYRNDPQYVERKFGLKLDKPKSINLIASSG
jgi:hypothetical protein